jgi:hypothetical protein
MAFAEQSKFFVNFTRGLVTDFTQLNFPENAATDMDNVDVFRTGEVKRRRGVDFESGYEISNHDIDSSGIETAAISIHEWEAVNGVGDLNFLVIQIGATLYFHNLGSDSPSTQLVGTLNLQSFAQGNGVPGDSLMDASFGEGVMIVTNPNMSPVIVRYNGDTNSFSATRINLQIRDFEGVDDGLGIEERPTNLSPEHRYNLLNQGWKEVFPISAGSETGNPIQVLRNQKGFYPSNADTLIAGKVGLADNVDNIGRFQPEALLKNVIGNTEAPKGHFILDVFDQDRSSVSGVPNVDGITIAERPSVTAFYAGRVWYAGVTNNALLGDVFFSQTLTDVKFAGRCYQEADPTAEDINNLVATDGGVIHIADMGQVYKMEVVGQDLVVVAANGLWAISGTAGGNFRADDFTVRKITDIGTTSADSVVEAEGALFYWSRGGIYAVTSGQISDVLEVARLSRDRIQNFYDDIPQAGRAYARAYYDEFDKRIFWFYNDTPEYDAIDFRFRYNRALVYDLTLQAFFPYTISDLEANSPFIAGMLEKEAGSESILSYNVVQGNDNVVQGSDNVVEDIAFPTFSNIQLKLLTILQAEDSNYEYTLSEFNSTDFTDWKTWDQIKNGASESTAGADFTSYIQTGWQNFGDPIRNKRITHVTHWFNRTETGYVEEDGEIVFDNPSGCLAQVRWEWTDLDVGRWTKEQQAYRLLRTYIPADVSDPFDYGFEIIKTKLRMRGKGHAFSIRYSSEPGKDFQLLGFAVNVRAPSKV